LCGPLSGSASTSRPGTRGNDYSVPPARPCTAEKAVFNRPTNNVVNNNEMKSDFSEASTVVTIKNEKGNIKQNEENTISSRNLNNVILFKLFSNNDFYLLIILDAKLSSAKIKTESSETPVNMILDANSPKTNLTRPPTASSKSPSK
jgi:hypothetical protein